MKFLQDFNFTDCWYFLFDWTNFHEFRIQTEPLGTDFYGSRASSCSVFYKVAALFLQLREQQPFYYSLDNGVPVVDPFL